MPDEEAFISKVATAARKSHYQALDAQTAALVKALAKDHCLDEAEDALHAYGVYLEHRDDAFEFIEVQPTNRVFGPLPDSA